MVDPSSFAQLGGRVTGANLATGLAWTLSGGFFVIVAQAGLALVEAGHTQARSAAPAIATKLVVYGIGILCFWAAGFALETGGRAGGDASSSAASEAFVRVAGKDLGLFGTAGFGLLSAPFTATIASLFLFRFAWLGMATTIPSGAMAERWALPSLVLFSIASSTLVCPVYGNWVWGGGWLATLGKTFGWGHGHVNFAGSSVVHLTGGVMALVGAKAVGPRAGKYAAYGAPRPMPGRSKTLAFVGAVVLALGGLGLSLGAALASPRVRVGTVATNSALASLAGGAVASAHAWVDGGAPDATASGKGLLAGLVAIGASCAFVGPAAAIVIGGAAGAIVIFSTRVIERTARIDDPVGAIAVHGACGLWGTLGLGLLADGRNGDGINGVVGPVRGLIAGDGGQLVASIVGIVANVVYVGLLSAAALFVIGKLVGNRSVGGAELDDPGHGGPPFVITRDTG